MDDIQIGKQMFRDGEPCPPQDSPFWLGWQFESGNAAARQRSLDEWMAGIIDRPYPF